MNRIKKRLASTKYSLEHYDEPLFSATIKTWCDSINGNTYHSVEVLCPNGETLYQGMTYGYGYQYKETTRKLLKGNGYDVHETFNDFAKSNICAFREHEVSRQRDL